MEYFSTTPMPCHITRLLANVSNSNDIFILFKVNYLRNNKRPQKFGGKC